jgi:nitrate/nitrite transport system substrate-binding protein
MHNFLLRYYLAENGLNPDTDVQLRVIAARRNGGQPAAGNIDGFLGPDPFNQRAVYDEAGFIHVLTKDLWNGHPCCAFGTSTEFIQKNPNTFAALYRAVLTAAAMAREPANRELIAKVIAPAQYLNQPEAVLNQVLTGKFADGLGNIKNVPDRADFRPHALAEHGGVDAHADEALGLCEGRRQLQADCRESVPADRRQEAHEVSGPESA